MGVIIIGGGIVGLTTALQLTRRYQGLPVTVIEQEEEVAAHQTGHNSGVVLAGVYYAPGSLKAGVLPGGRPGDTRNLPTSRPAVRAARQAHCGHKRSGV